MAESSDDDDDTSVSLSSSALSSASALSVAPSAVAQIAATARDVTAGSTPKTAVDGTTMGATLGLLFPTALAAKVATFLHHQEKPSPQPNLKPVPSVLLKLSQLPWLTPNPPSHLRLLRQVMMTR